MYYALNNCKLKTSVPAPCSLPPGAGDVSPLHGEEEPLLHDGEDAHLLVRRQVSLRPRHRRAGPGRTQTLVRHRGLGTLEIQIDVIMNKMSTRLHYFYDHFHSWSIKCIKQSE